MWKSCARCGKIHKNGEECPVKRIRKATPDSELRNTWAWHEKAEQVKRDSNYLCPLCLEEGVATYEGLETHHIEKLKDAPEKLLDGYNLIPLCVRHHKMADAGEIDSEHLRELARQREDKTTPT